MEISIETFIKVFLVLEFSLPLNFNECKEKFFFQAIYLSYFFYSYLMSKIIKLQINPDRIVNIKLFLDLQYRNKLQHFAKYLAKSFSMQNSSKNFSSI